MARRKQKKSTSILGAFMIEGLAVVVFLFLFIQARAERQRSIGVEKSGLPVIKEMFQQTPFQDLLAQGQSWKN